MSSSQGGAAAPRSWALKAALVLIAAGVAALLYVVFAASSKPQAQGLARFSEGALARLQVLDAPPAQPAEAFSDGAGGTGRLADYRGEVVLVNLWATWCAPCMAEMPTLAALQRRFQGRGFKVVPISVDSEGDLAKARAELARLSGGGLPFLADYSRAVLFAVAAPGMPTTILYDRQGREIARLAGEADWSSDEAAALIEAALAGES